MAAFDITPQFGDVPVEFNTSQHLETFVLDFRKNPVRSGDVIMLQDDPLFVFFFFASCTIIRPEGSAGLFQVGYGDRNDPLANIGFNSSLMNNVDANLPAGTTTFRASQNGFGVTPEGSNFDIFFTKVTMINGLSNALVQINIEMFPMGAPPLLITNLS